MPKAMLHRNLCGSEWPNFKGKCREETIGLRVVSEGIAEYISRRVNPTNSNFDDKAYPLTLLTLLKYGDNTLFYEGGHHLVKPIIDKHGPKAIEYLVQNLPDSADVFDLPAYRQRVMDSLDVL